MRCARATFCPGNNRLASRPAGLGRKLVWGFVGPFAAILASLSPGAEPQKATPSAERILILAPLTPVFIRLDIETGPQSIAAIRRKFAESQFQRFDKDKSGTITVAEIQAWQAAGRADRFLDPILARLRETPNDVPLERFVSIVEENLGLPFQVIADRKRLDQSVDLFPMLDRNGDGRLSTEEVEKGISMLRGNDFDDDESLSVAELQPFPRSIIDARRQQAAIESPDIPVLSLSSEKERDVACDRILEVYREGPSDKSVALQRLATNGTGPGDRPEIARFDDDKDSRLSREELRAWLDSQPVDAVVQVFLDRSRVRVQEATFSSVVRKGESAVSSRPALVVGGLSVDFVARNNRVDQQDNVYFYKLDFRRGDKDKNGYLDEMEFAQAGMSGMNFASVDLDGNKQVTLEEVVQHAETDGRIAQAKLVVNVGDEAKSLFQIIDADLDRRLTIREFTNARRAIRPLDADRNGISPQELVSRYRLRFSFGTPDRMQRRGMDDAMATGVPIARPPETSGPAWFRRMDRNQDGDLSWREFLGDLQTFKEIDTDGNGLVDLDEAIAADGRLRTPPEAPAAP